MCQNAIFYALFRAQRIELEHKREENNETES